MQSVSGHRGLRLVVTAVLCSSAAGCMTAKIEEMREAPTQITADEAIVDRLAAQFGINVIREKDGTITHNLRTAIIDPSGRVSTILENNAWTADQLIAGLKDALAASR